MDIYREKILENIKKYSERILRDSNVIGVGLGNKIIDGYMLNIPTLTITVEKKLNMSSMSSYNRIPKQIDGILTDIVECKNNVFDAYKQNNLIRPFKISLPARGGCSCKNYFNKDSKGGSIAHAVVDSKGEMYILSCANVLAKDSEMVPSDNPFEPDVIWYPGNGSLSAPGFPKEIAKNIKVTPVRYDRPNKLNAAIAHVNSPDSPNYRKIVDSGFELKNEPIKKIKEVVAGNKVFKYGPLSGKVEGKVISINTRLSVTIFDKKYPFENQVLVDILYDEADKGTMGLLKSAAVIEDAASAWGMCIGGSTNNKLGIFTPIQDILTYFNVTILDMIRS